MTSRTNKAKRHMDVFTTRPSGGALGKSSEPHSSLAVEPIMIADLNHLSVDDSLEVYDDCAFYPTGYKNLNMKNTMEETVRKYSRPANLTKIGKTSTVLTKKLAKKKLDPTMPTEPCCYTRTRVDKHANDELKAMLEFKVHQERRLRSTVTPEF